jgi:hypothetical protein
MNNIKSMIDALQKAKINAFVCKTKPKDDTYSLIFSHVDLMLFLNLIGRHGLINDYINTGKDYRIEV